MQTISSQKGLIWLSSKIISTSYTLIIYQTLKTYIQICDINILNSGNISLYISFLIINWYKLHRYYCSYFIDPTCRSVLIVTQSRPRTRILQWCHAWKWQPRQYTLESATAFADSAQVCASIDNVVFGLHVTRKQKICLIWKPVIVCKDRCTF